MYFSHKANSESLINKHEGVGLKHRNDSKAFTEYSNYKDDIYQNNNTI